jgi:nucleotide-binding universal stress UspA family protein
VPARVCALSGTSDERDLVDRADVMEQLRGALVVAVDASPPSAVALRFAADLAGRTGAELHVLMVWNVLIGPAPRASGDQHITEQDRQQEAERVLAAFVESTLEGAGGPPLHLHAVHANVDSLLRETSAVAAHVVVGSRGRGGVADLVLGSVSADLVNHARCPVTVVPPA